MKVSIDGNSQHLSQMVSQISHTYDFDRNFLEKRCGLSASLYGTYTDMTKPPHTYVPTLEHIEELNINVEDKWYEHEPQTVTERANITILWDMPIQTDREIKANRPDVVIKDKQVGEKLPTH